MERMGHASARAALIYQHATREHDEAITAAMTGGGGGSPGTRKGGAFHELARRDGWTALAAASALAILGSACGNTPSRSNGGKLAARQAPGHRRRSASSSTGFRTRITSVFTMR